MPEMSENDILRAVFSHLRERPVDGVFAFHPKNEGPDLKGMRSGMWYGLGIQPGIPDVIVTALRFCPACAHQESAIYALELKCERRRGKSLTPHEIKQSDCRKVMARVGWVTGVAYGLDEAVAWLEDHGLLRGEAQLRVSGERP